MADGVTRRRTDLCCADADCRFLAIFSAGPSSGLRWRYRRPPQADSFHRVVDDGRRVDSSDLDYRRRDVSMDTLGAHICALGGGFLVNTTSAVNLPSIGPTSDP